jgi:hypothetical protein
MTTIALWQPATNELVPATAETPLAIAEYALQLAKKDKVQIVAAFESGHFEMGVTYLWGRTINALKKELSNVGVGLIGEMLGRTDVDEDDDINDILTEKEAIRLAEELGVISSTDGMRLRHTYELITHFSQMDGDDGDLERLKKNEALASFEACVSGVLGRPKIEVATKFIEFRSALESKSIQEGDPYVEMLKGSPYFFYKLTISVLMNAAKKNVGANLEHALANINTLVPALWDNLRHTERWQVGHAYAEAYADGKTTVVGGLKSALLKVKGFDFVPENLRSDTFVKAADAIIKAHEGLNNFFNEAAAVKALTKLGTTIPTPAFPACLSALLCITLGNQYGVAWTAQTEARSIMDSITTERWAYYLNNVLPSDTRIFGKLFSQKPRSNFIALVKERNLSQVEFKNKTVQLLIEAAAKDNDSKLASLAHKMHEEYYGKMTKA